MDDKAGVDIYLIDQNDTPIGEVVNPYGTDYSDYPMSFYSRLISTSPGGAFKVCIKFRESYNLGLAPGVKIFISCGNDLFTNGDRWCWSFS